jgi:hypothetical protein
MISAPHLPESNPFPYSTDCPPPLDVLRQRLFVVHATEVMPSDEYLRPGARDISINQEWQGEEPPAFRPTLHFSLGSVVPEHGGGRYSWDDHPYAVVAPLGSVERQVVNLFAHDTFVLGKLALNQEGVALIVPGNAQTTHLPEDVKVHRYEPGTALRKAVDDYIIAQKGWRVMMQHGDVDTGSSALIGRQEINDPAFFASLLKERPYISFGTHTRSVLGEAYRYGLVESAIRSVGEFTQGYNPLNMALQRALGLDALRKLEASVRASSIDPIALSSFEVKQAKALAWLNLIDCDMYMGRIHGKSLAYAPKHLVAGLRTRRADPSALREYAELHMEELKNTSPAKPPYYPRIGAQMSSMTPLELQQFADQHEDLFNNLDTSLLHTFYALERMLAKGDGVNHESLEGLLADSVRQLRMSRNEAEIRVITDSIIESLSTALDPQSSALSTALRILNNPELRSMLAIDDPDRPVADLTDWLGRYPETAIAFTEPTPPTEEQQEIRNMLTAMKLRREVSVDSDGQLPITYREAYFTAISRRREREQLASDSVDFLDSMSKRRTAAIVNNTLNQIQVLERDYSTNAAALWAPLGLAGAYRARFPNDEAFWSSPKSFYDIYRQLYRQTAQ